MTEVRKDKQKRYEIICPYCGKAQYACKSLAHDWGIADAGHGNCLKCGGFMKLLYNQKNDSMTAEEWEIRGKESVTERNKRGF